MTNKLIQYLLDNEKYFVPVLDYFDNNFNRLPKKITIHPFYDGGEIDSVMVTIKNEFVYVKIKSKYISQCAQIIDSKTGRIFSLHGKTSTVSRLLELLDKTPREYTEYYTMVLVRKYHDKDCSISRYTAKGFVVKKTDETYFNALKTLQKKYHKEEVYGESDSYPYKSEMINYKKTLSSRINFAVFTNDCGGDIDSHSNQNKVLPVSKVNVNGESLKYIQIGGVFTLKRFRNRGLSTLCLTHFLDYVFRTVKKDIILFVKKNNLPAVNLYKKLGFKIDYNLSICYF